MGRHCSSLTPADHIAAAVSLKNVEFSHRASGEMDDKAYAANQHSSRYGILVVPYVSGVEDNCHSAARYALPMRVLLTNMFL